LAPGPWQSSMKKLGVGEDNTYLDILPYL